jgi:hypothetical protein
MAPLLSYSQYQVRARSTAFYPNCMQPRVSGGCGGHPTAMAYVVLKLNGEAGEAAEVLGKTWRNAGEALVLDPVARLLMLDEVGDANWYLNMIASELGASMESVAQYNLFKLAKRAELGKEGWDEAKKEELLIQYWQQGNALIKESPVTK